MSKLRQLNLHAIRQTRTPASQRSLSTRAQRVLSALDLPTNDAPMPGVFDGQWGGQGDILLSTCPATGEVIGRVQGVSPQIRFLHLAHSQPGIQATPDETRQAIERTTEAARLVRAMPAPKRGEVIRQMRVALARKVGKLGDLVSLEMGKIKSEGKGEVQEVSAKTKLS